MVLNPIGFFCKILGHYYAEPAQECFEVYYHEQLRGNKLT